MVVGEYPLAGIHPAEYVVPVSNPTHHAASTRDRLHFIL